MKVSLFKRPFHQTFYEVSKHVVVVCTKKNEIRQDGTTMSVDLRECKTLCEKKPNNKLLQFVKSFPEIAIDFAGPFHIDELPFN